MRLGQLARKVNIKPAQIISFLEKEHNIIVEDNLNSKIEDESLALVMNEFKIEEKIIEPKKELVIIIEEEEIVSETLLEDNTEDVIPDTVEVETIIETTKKEVIVEENTVVVKETLTVIDEDGEEIELNVVDGIIKVQKKELEGFKVVGKIDLPQKKKSVIFIHTKGSESIDVTDKIDEQKNEVAKRKKELYLERKNKRQDRNKKNKRGPRKVLTELEIKERENKLAVEKSIKQSKAKKELKKKHYKQNIQPNVVAPKKKKKKIDGNEKTSNKYDKEATTTWGKLMKWFNT